MGPRLNKWPETKEGLSEVTPGCEGGGKGVDWNPKDAVENDQKATSKFQRRRGAL